MKLPVRATLPTMPASEESRRRAGERIHQERSRRGWSVENAMEYGGIGHMTWRRIERGEAVQAKSYTAVDRAFGWQSGHTHAAIDAGTDVLSSTPGTGQADDDAPGMEASTRLNEAVQAMHVLPLHDLKALHAMATHRVAEREQRISAIHNIIQERIRGARPEGEFLDPDAVSGLPTKKIREYTEALYAYHRYHRQLSELATEVYDLENQPEMDISDLDDLYRQVTNLGLQIEDTIHVLDRLERNSTETEQ